METEYKSTYTKVKEHLKRNARLYIYSAWGIGVNIAYFSLVDMDAARKEIAEAKKQHQEQRELTDILQK